MADERIAEIVDRCERYWRQTRVPNRAVREMKAELGAHLAEAVAEGKSPEAVVGRDVLEFAESWAGVHRGTLKSPRMAWPAEPRARWTGLALLAAAIAVVVLALIFGPEEDGMDAEVWQWVWVGAAVVLAVAEMLTAGLFMLPFAVGAGAAAVLAFAGVAVPVQFIVLIVVSILSLVALQRFAHKDDDVPVPFGANRYLGKRAMVLESIGRTAGTGRVRMDTEQWRATTDIDDVIPVGTEVQVVEVRGTRLVVETLD